MVLFMGIHNAVPRDCFVAICIEQSTTQLALKRQMEWLSPPYVNLLRVFYLHREETLPLQLKMIPPWMNVDFWLVVE